MRCRPDDTNRLDLLTDDVLLQIFDTYMMIMNRSYIGKPAVEAWQSLVHVCRRWRSLVFLSPRRLNLHLLCTPQTPTKDKLDVWPPVPLIVEGTMSLSSTDNVIAALGQSNRVCEIVLRCFVDWQLERVLAAMQVSFPELTDLRLFSNDKSLPVIPNSFLDGSAPHLRILYLHAVPFPGLPRLLSSTTHLVDLALTDIPHSGYISPEAMIALISMLSNLKSFELEFRSPQSHPDWEIRHLYPSKRSVIPALTQFLFKGVFEYLEDLVTCIDTPRLEFLHITFFNQINFDTPRLVQFINRTPRLRKHDAHLQFRDRSAVVKLPTRFGGIEIEISCREPDWQLSSIAQVCNSSLPPPSMVEDLYIWHRYWKPVWENDVIENDRWLELLLPFTAVENLYLSKEFAPGIAAALQEVVGAGISEILPSLQNIFVEGLDESGLFREGIRRFAVARRLLNHPISISDWDGIETWTGHGRI